MKQIATRQNGNDLCPLFLSSKGPFAGYRTSLIRRVKSGRRRRRKLFHIHHQRAISWGPSKQNTTWNHVMFLTWTISPPILHMFEWIFCKSKIGNRRLFKDHFLFNENCFHFYHNPKNVSVGSEIDMAIDLTQRQMQSATNHFSLMNQLS